MGIRETKAGLVIDYMELRLIVVLSNLLSRSGLSNRRTEEGRETDFLRRSRFQTWVDFDES